jgi:guanosine-3',5'-bis(diphosphate) 3'-pyrophosphohydrolase
MTATLIKEKRTKSVVNRQRSRNQEELITLQPKVRNRYRRIFEKILKEIQGYTRNPNIELIKDAYQFAYHAHKHQLRKSGVPYIGHCLETTKILVELRMDVVTIVAGLLHDVVEDTGITIDEVRERFGGEIAQLVDGVTKISELKFRSHAEKQAENFRKMIFSMAQDLRVIMIKFADRLHNMRTLEYLPPQKAKRIAVETREVYAPLAHRFGIARIKWELEDLSLKFIESKAYYNLVQQISERREERERYINRVTEPILHELNKNGIQAKVAGRAKSLYSIYRKMKERNKPLEEIYDLLAIRIVVEKVDECYFALGVVHTIFTPVQDRFKDYVATPKLNMYQSLHTTVVGPDGKMIEIQFRTQDMHRIAEIGIAAHWKYKEGGQSDDELDQYSAWLREMIDWQKDTLDPEEYLEVLKTDLFRSEVFVFTPKGDLLKLPAGSTPVDFAFSVHTDIGLQCIGAKVNGRIVPLNTKLKSGDSVEIITSTNQRPNKDWITFIKTSKAKSKIKRWLKEARYQEAVKLGDEIFNKSLKRYRIRPNKEQLHHLIEQLNKAKMEQIYAELGQGDLPIQKVMEILAPEKVSKGSLKKEEKLFERFVMRARGTVRGIRVQGMDHLLIRFAQCCHPVPGDPIVGFITKGRGIVVHRRDCINIIKLMEVPEKMIDVSWDVDGEKAFMVQVRILAEGRKDFLRDVSESLSSMDTNILTIDMKTENALITAYMVLEVKDLSHLTRILKMLYRIRGVLSVGRESGNKKVVKPS